MERVGLAVLLVAVLPSSLEAQNVAFGVSVGGFRPSPSLERFGGDAIVCGNPPCPSDFHREIQTPALTVGGRLSLLLGARTGIDAAVQVADFANVIRLYGTQAGRQDVRVLFVSLQPSVFLPVEKYLGLTLAAGPSLAVTNATTTDSSAFGLIEGWSRIGLAFSAALQALLRGPLDVEARVGGHLTEAKRLDLAWGVGFSYSLGGAFARDPETP